MSLRFETKEFQEEFMKMWNEGTPIHDMRKHFGIAVNTIYYLAGRYGLTLRRVKIPGTIRTRQDGRLAIPIAITRAFDLKPSTRYKIAIDTENKTIKILGELVE